MMAALRTAQLEKSTLSHRFLFKHRYTADQQAPPDGWYTTSVCFYVPNIEKRWRGILLLAQCASVSSNFTGVMELCYFHYLYLCVLVPTVPFELMMKVKFVSDE